MSDIKIIEYNSDSGFNSLPKLFNKIWGDIKNSKELAWRLLLRNIRAQYRQSFLGIIWAFIPPIISSLTWILLNNFKLINITNTNIPYPVFVLTGTILWQGFIDALFAPLRSISANKSLLAKINFPHEALLLSGLGETLFNFGIKLVLLIPVYFWFNINPSYFIALVPFGIIALLLFGFMIGLILSPICLLLEDVSKALTTFSALWMFLTPVIYPTPN
jgi:lipopolysaccharide transport system permease protein